MTTITKIGKLYKKFRRNTGDPDALAAKIAKELPDTDREELFHKLLRSWVLDRLSLERNDPERIEVPKNSGRSPKVTGIRSVFWEQICATMINTPDGYKKFGDCTADDLLFAVKVREEHAAATLAEADKFRKAATLMITHGSAKVSELPVKAQVEIEQSYN